MYSIQRTYNGIRATAIPGKDMHEDTFYTFQYALGSFGYLLPWNESSTGEQWAALIKASHADSPRIKRVIEAIKQAMPTTETIGA